MQRRSLVAFASLSVVACAAAPFKPLEFTPPVPLQDALPGYAIVYLLRAPHDNATVPVYFNGTKVASLPPDSYTAVSLLPGNYTISSLVPDASSSLQSSGASVLTVAAGERRFLYTAVPTKSTTSLLLAPIKAGVIPLFLPLRVPIGARFWRECGEQDAQGLLSISKVVAPEQDAL